MSEQANNKKIGIIIGLVIVGALFTWVIFSLTRLKNAGKEIHLYNPHTENLLVNIGEEQYDLKPYEMREIDLSPGEYMVKSRISDQVIIENMIKVDRDLTSGGGLINLSGESLYLWTEYYGSGIIEGAFDSGDGSVQSPIDQAFAEGARMLMVDSTLVFGNIEEFGPDELVLIKQWDYNLKQPFEDEIAVSNHRETISGKAKKKLFDKQDLLAYWNQTYAGEEVEAVESDTTVAEENSFLDQIEP